MDKAREARAREILAKFTGLSLHDLCSERDDYRVLQGSAIKAMLAFATEASPAGADGPKMRSRLRQQFVIAALSPPQGGLSAPTLRMEKILDAEFVKTPPQDGVTQPGGDMVLVPRVDAQALLDDLNDRIDDAAGDAVPVFAGIVALHAALAAAPTAALSCDVTPSPINAGNIVYRGEEWVPIEAYREAMNGWKAANSKAAPDVVAEHDRLRQAARYILPYLEWTIGSESPGHHPTMPSAVAGFRAALNPSKGDDR